LTIKNETEFHQAVFQTAQAIGARHPAMAREWIEAAPLTPAMKAQLQSSLDRTRTAGRP
jgi:hypothetical protein